MSSKPDTKMFKPSLRDPKTLVVLAVVAIGAFIIAEFSRREMKLSDFDLKLDAARRMESCLIELKNWRFGNVSISDAVNDPNASAVVGRQESPITIEEGKLEEALTSINPNIAAAVVSYLKEAGIQRGDKVAVGLTGSLPGLNLATICALEALEAQPVLITSLGATQWGANDPAFTWLDMESVLYKTGKIKEKSVLASIGGGGDNGRGLSDVGRQLLRDAIQRNQVELLESSSLDSSIELRIAKYEQVMGGKPKLFISVGGGTADLGHSQNTWLIPTGSFVTLPPRNYPNVGVLHHYSELGIPFVHLFDVGAMAREFELPKSPVPLPEPGKGGVFYALRYDIRVTSAVLLVFLLIFGYVVNVDRKKYKLKEEGADPDTLPTVK